ncbi:MAG: hypothetical protein GC156_06045 [Actinomycetales bacterium]|nr:hypothetical protein [Actinomycetales bacterium]
MSEHVDGSEPAEGEDFVEESAYGEDSEDVLVLEEVESELVLPMWEPTGQPRVDEALEALTTLDPDDVHQHAAVYDQVHQQLRGALTDLDSSA